MADKDQLEKVRRTINVLADMDCSDREECGATTDRVIEYLRELATEMKAEIDAFDEAVAAGPLSEPIGSTDHLDAVTTASITYRVSGPTATFTHEPRCPLRTTPQPRRPKSRRRGSGSKF